MTELQPTAAQMQRREFLLWLAPAPRSFDETMAALRTSCPRFPTWEDALAEGLVQVTRQPGMASYHAMVTLKRQRRAALDNVDAREPASSL